MADLITMTATIQVTGFRRERPTTAKLRRELHDPATTHARRCRIYDWLLYRRHRRTW